MILLGMIQSFKYDVGYSFSWVTFISLRRFAFIPTVLGAFIRELDFVKRFPVSI